ncbi:hypothetical protein [Geobacillus sp. C56-T2]|uniref:hypothetical protein n=1 Tax=Geobacillus sp. C56-T2 TaxID=600773 RepID=UPI0011A2A43F|nr:hypothetical protein [Geobacillus sp. C56-T2]TWG30012.1 hypothetical protein GC56T2_1127 [Geobacillus sp. C56-T2]
MSPFLFGCKFMLANLLIYSKDIKTVGKLVETVKELSEEELTTLDIPEELQKQKSSKKDSIVMLK